MNDEEYNAHMATALELVDWLHSKTNNSHGSLLILGRAFALTFADSVKKGVKCSAAKRAILSALGHEIDSARDYYKSRKQ